MSQLALSTIDSNHIEEISSSKKEPDWLKQYRKNSLSVYDQLPIETSPLYNKYTDAKRMDPTQVLLSSISDTNVPDFLSKRMKELENETCIIQIGTNITRVNLPDELKSKGLVVSSLDDAIKNNPDLIKKALEISNSKEDKFTALNNAGLGRTVNTVEVGETTYNVVRISSGQIRQYGLVDDAGQVVSAMSIDLSKDAGKIGVGGTETLAAFQKQGLHSALLRAIKSHDPVEFNKMLVARASDISKTEGGAKGTRAMARIATEGGYASLVDNVVDKIRTGDFASLAPDEIALIRRYGKALKADIVSFGDEATSAKILSDRGVNKAIVGIDSAATDAAYKMFGDLGMEAVRADSIADA